MVMDIISVLCVLVLMYEVITFIVLSLKAFWKALAHMNEVGSQYTVRFVLGNYSVHIMSVTATWLICRHLLKIF